MFIIYKILPSIATSLFFHHTDAKIIISNKQKGNTSHTYGTINQLIVINMVMDNMKLKQRNVSRAQIDHKNAFDSVLHNWIIETLKNQKLDLIATEVIRKQ